MTVDNWTSSTPLPSVNDFSIAAELIGNTRASTIEIWELVLKSFTIAGCSCKLTIAIATTTFSMGIHCPVIHWGPPGDAEAYAQEEFGRAG